VTTLLGASVAGYTIEAVAGRGGMGIVYRARDSALERTVALKLIAPELAADSGFRARFEREMRVTAQLDHPNVIPVLGAGEEDGRLYLAMRWVDGTDLGLLIRERGALAPALAAELIAQAASALDAAHARGLVHRDVKPGNLLLPEGERPHVYLTDFGLAKRDESTALTTTGGWIGTPDFAAPEQIEGRPLDARADVYALGCVLFAALAGRPPFADVPALRKPAAQVDEPPPLGEVPPAFRPLLGRALAKDPSDRQTSAGELGAEAVAAASGHSPPTAATRRLVEPRRPRAGRRSAAVALFAAGLVAAGLAIAALSGLFDGDGGPQQPASADRSPVLPAPAPTTTVRCSDTSCTQDGQRVQPPIEGGECGTGTWSRIDADAEPLFACAPESPPAAGPPAQTPDLAGARLDRAEDYLDRLGVGHDTSGGGTFGPVVRSNWVVCTTAPAAGAALPSGEELKLFVDRSC
jgi:serine/threonine protein kinase